MREATTIFLLALTFMAFCFAFGGKNTYDRSNGAKVASAGLVAAAILCLAWSI